MFSFFLLFITARVAYHEAAKVELMLTGFDGDGVDESGRGISCSRAGLVRLIQALLFCLLASSEAPFVAAAVLGGLSIMMVLAVMGSVVMLSASSAGLPP